MMSGHWDVEKCNNKQLEFAVAGHECREWTGWSPQRRGGMVEEMTVCISVPNNSVALSAPQLHRFNRLIASAS